MRGRELIHAFERKRERFFDQAMAPGLEHLGSHGHMVGGGGADNDRGAGGTGHGRFPIGGSLHFILLRHVGENCGSGITSDDVASTGGLKSAQMAFADAAATNDENGGKFAHGRLCKN